MRKEFSFWVMWSLLIFGLALIVICLIIAKPAKATTWFNPVPNTLVNGATGLSAQVDANYNSIIADGNAANTNLLAQIAALGPGGLPAGAVVAFNSVCPTGFALADGKQGRPQAEGLYIRGLDNQAGRDPNRVLGSYQADQIQNHFHSLVPVVTNFITTILIKRGTAQFSAFLPSLIFPGTSTMISPIGGTETRPASIVYNYCINNNIGTSINPFSPSPQLLSNLIVPDANVMMADYNQIISDGNIAFNKIQAAITAAGAFTPMPAGAVVPFNLAVCPSGWVAADGTGGTVDMRGRFARITTGTPSVGTVQTDQFIDHTHTVVGTYLNGTPDGNFSITPNTGTLDTLSGYSFMSVLDATGANVGTETRPQNVAQLYCQKS